MYIVKFETPEEYGSTYYNRQTADEVDELVEDLLDRSEGKATVFRAVQQAERKRPELSYTEL